MTTTTNLALPFIDAAQAQKEVTHNEALILLDALVQGRVKGRHLSAPPAAPAEGEAWIVGPGATGAWTGQSGRIALWQSGWRFLVPRAGWRLWDEQAQRLVTFSGSAWGDLPAEAMQIPTLALGWIGYGSGFAGPRYWRDAHGRVSIEGLMQAGTDGTVFSLLPGYRPPARLMFACWSGGGAYRVDVTPAGEVIVQGSNSVFSSLAGITFLAAG